MAKAANSKKKTFHQQIGLQFKGETSKVLHMGRSFCMVLEKGGDDQLDRSCEI